MNVLRWDPVMSSGVAFMDEDHRQVLAELADIQDMVAAGRLADAKAAFARMIVDTRAHFAEEESLMRRNGFAGYGLHKLEHDDFLDHMERFARQFGTGGIALHEDMLRFISLWFLGHILGSDRMLGTSCAAEAA